MLQANANGMRSTVEDWIPRAVVAEPALSVEESVAAFTRAVSVLGRRQSP